MPPANHIDQIENRQSMDHGEVNRGQAEREADTIGQERSPLVVYLPQVTEEQTLERTHYHNSFFTCRSRNHRSIAHSTSNSEEW